MKVVHIVAFILLVIGGLLWAVWALSGWGIDSVLGVGLAKLVYIVVGLAAIYEVVTHKKNCKMCESKPAGM